MSLLEDVACGCDIGEQSKRHSQCRQSGGLEEKLDAGIVDGIERLDFGVRFGRISLSNHIFVAMRYNRIGGDERG